MNNFKYRPDIDGLRAIAVLLVIIFHMNAEWIPGGFIGVDVFFVISGFIITSAIYPQMRAREFSFNQFYVKRIKRILPLFYLVALTSLALSYWLYTPNDFVSFADSLRYASSFIANIYFEKNSGYFAPASETLPLLHTWSLSIEEQFYFVWPIVLILAVKFLYGRGFTLLLGALLLSLIGYSEYLTTSNPEGGYYFIQSRAFELLVGALLAIGMFHKRLANISFQRQIYQIAGLIGLLSLLSLAWVLDESVSFPGFNALLVTLATALLIFSGESKPTLVSSLLSQRPFVLVGRLSYSLYLWHWPVLAFYRYYYSDFYALDALYCAVITLTLSVVSWQVVENPLRHLNVKRRWVYLFYLVLPIAASVTVAKNIAFNDGYPERFSAEALRLYSISSNTFEEIKVSLPATERFEIIEPYIFGETAKELNAIIWGDSHAGHFRGIVDELGKEYGFSAMYGGGAGCPPVLGVNLIKYGVPEKPCTQRNNIIFSEIIESDAEVVFLAARWAMYSETTRAVGEKGSRVYLGDASDYSESVANSRRALQHGLERSIEQLLAENKKVVLFNQVPVYSYKPSNCWVKKARYGWLSETSCSISVEEVSNRFSFTTRMFDTLLTKYPSVTFIDVISLLCDSKECVSKLGATPLYSDNNHLNDLGSRKLLLKMKQKGEFLAIEQLFGQYP